MADQVVLVTGATGFLGRQVHQAFKDSGFKTVGVGHTRSSPPSILKADLSEEAAVHSLLDEIRPNIVVHCAANRHPDKCDQDPEGARKVNVEATRFLVEACLKHEALCVYISTDYVFPGAPGES